MRAGLRERPEIAVAHFVHGFEASRVVATQAGKNRRIVAGQILRRAAVSQRRGESLGQQAADSGAADSDWYAVEKVAACDCTLCSRAALMRALPFSALHAPLRHAAPFGVK